ncbi:hypothetical protein RhiirA1_467893 [Rhizophagus irregularis]|uniref:Uncharacterized protein n=1 Tax=Rhizophagus irregularis TaxID=588596 RepID=A0A2N0RB66_9GLOM|nr:hypothetical protein RhiirA1_467893 [Rhizophagus irregularis]
MSTLKDFYNETVIKNWSCNSDSVFDTTCKDKAQTILDNWKNWTTTRKSTKRPSEVKIGRLQVKKVKNIATATGGVIQFVDNNVVYSQCVDGSNDDFQPIRTIQPKRKNISSKKVGIMAKPTNERNTKTSSSSPSLVTPIAKA